MIVIKIFRLLYSEYIGCLSKAWEQPLASSSVEPSNKYCCLCTTLSKEVVQSRKETGEAVGKKAAQKQEELGYEHTLQNRELVIDNIKSNKCVSTFVKGIEPFLVKILHKKLRCELRIASEGKKYVAAETDQCVIFTSPLHIEITLLV